MSTRGRPFRLRRRLSTPVRGLRARLRRWSLVARGVLPARRPPCVVGIPMMNLHDRTGLVLADLDLGDVDEVVIFDHGSDDPASLAWLAQVERHPKVTVERRAAIPEESLYRAWNDTIRRAQARWPEREVDVVLLNNDVRLPPGFVWFLTGALRAADPRAAAVFPDRHVPLRAGMPGRLSVTPTRGLYPEGGLTGWAFAVRSELFGRVVPYIDERLKLYSGDRDLVHNLETRGYHAAQVDGLPCGHRLGTTRRLRPELKGQQQRDVQLWWSEHRGEVASE